MRSGACLLPLLPSVTPLLQDHPLIWVYWLSSFFPEESLALICTLLLNVYLLVGCALLCCVAFIKCALQYYMDQKWIALHIPSIKGRRRVSSTKRVEATDTQDSCKLILFITHLLWFGSTNEVRGKSYVCTPVHARLPFRSPLPL